MHKVKKTFRSVDAKQVVGIAAGDLARVQGGLKLDQVDGPSAPIPSFKWQPSTLG